MAGVGAQVVQVLDFAQARAPELRALHELAHHAYMQTEADSKLQAQRNQRRRRANAFKSHQMPRRLRIDDASMRKPGAQQEQVIDLRLPRGGDSSGAQRKAPAPIAASDAKPRCRKHERRMHKMYQERSWLHADNAAANTADTADTATDSDAVEMRDARDGLDQDMEPASTAHMAETEAVEQEPEDDDHEEEPEGAPPRPKWLATHAWHAKRMDMQPRYGYMLAQRHQDKSESAALAALRKTAIVHDMSYHGLLELYGRPQLIMEALQLVTDPSGSLFEDTSLLSGQQEAQAMLYHMDQFPMGAIAPVSFLWRPCRDDVEAGEDVDMLQASSTHPHGDSAVLGTRLRQLWVWIHPAAFMEAATAIAQACQAAMSEHGADEQIEILDRRGHLCRLRLRGKQVDDILKKVLVPSSLARGDSDAMNAMDRGEQSDHEDGFASSLVLERGSTSHFQAWQTVLQCQGGRTGSTMINPDPPTDVFAITAQDPRVRAHIVNTVLEPKTSLLEEPSDTLLSAQQGIQCPLSKSSLTSTSVGDEPDSARILEQLHALLAWSKGDPVASTGSLTYPFVAPSTNDTSLVHSQTRQGTDIEMVDANDVQSKSKSPSNPSPCSLLWSLTSRRRLQAGFHKAHQLNDTVFQRRLREKKKKKKKSKQAAMKMAINDGVDDLDQTSAYASANDLHLLMIRKREQFRHASGWDMLITPEFAPVLLNALVFAGAMVIGLDEDEAYATAMHAASFPRDYPDTAAGRAFWNDHASAKQAQQLRKPKGKRIAYDKLGVTYPFQPHWQLLFPDAVDSSKQHESSPPLSLGVLRNAEYMQPFAFARALTSAKDTEHPIAVSELVSVALPTLIRVILRIPRRGTLEPCSLLYIPTREDLHEFQANSKWCGRELDPNKMELLGIVTSAVYDRPKSAFRAIGFCSCEALQRVFLNQRSSTVVVMTRSPSSRLVRAVTVEPVV